jgi:pantoate--beta-alanine ligase
MMQVLRSQEACRKFRKTHAQACLGLVPTMGALHEGHGSLIQLAKNHADVVIVSIYVNPLQFGPTEDYQRYPRPVEQDLAYCQALGVDAVFMPEDITMYPDGHQGLTQIVPPAALTQYFCGASRPGHFTGVATVVHKLLALTQADCAVFGEKDFQQLAVIQAMVRDLNLPVHILRAPTVRELDGLAMSSRNQYLQTSAMRQAALVLSQVLQAFKDIVKHQPEHALAQVKASLLEAWARKNPNLAPLVTWDYLEPLNLKTLRPTDILLPGETQLLAAVWIKDDNTQQKVRLIDNIAL